MKSCMSALGSLSPTTYEPNYMETTTSSQLWRLPGLYPAKESIPGPQLNTDSEKWFLILGWWFLEILHSIPE
ncbi:hypothetical protein ILYODFUR_010660 [Ilyodon furcidens]|uniref:Uncharacterized protein n=1 Tax=Ilyodon furcidens TaxID=33524 RepID=A0ABV0VCY3_9TELE